MRQYVSFNTEDQPETPNNTRWEASMVRTSLYLETFSDFDWFTLTTRSRIDEEAMTDYLQNLETVRQRQPAFATAPDLDIDDELDEAEVRELYVDVDLTENISARIGRQQVVWGRTDLFQTMDIVNGFDFSWRAVFAESEQMRKPLWMIYPKIEFQNLDGTLELLYRPGWDDKDQVGTEFDTFGGRWTPQPFRGEPDASTPFLPGGAPTNFDHPDADPTKPSFGARWVGTFNLNQNLWEYTINYLHTLTPESVLNTNAPSFNPEVSNPYKGVIGQGSNNILVPSPPAPAPLRGEQIRPEVDLFGFTVNTYYAPLDIVPRMEVVYVIDQPYNVGTHERRASNCVPITTVPGTCGIIEKDTLKWSVSFDKNITWVQDYLGAYRQGLLSIQLFDEWIVNFEDDDDIVESDGFGTARDEHKFIATMLLEWNYDSDNYNPFFLPGWNLSTGGGLIIYGLNVQWGTNWRFTVEHDLFFPEEEPLPGEAFTTTDYHPPFDFLANADQLLFRATYQF